MNAIVFTGTHNGIAYKVSESLRGDKSVESEIRLTGDDDSLKFKVLKIRKAKTGRGLTTTYRGTDVDVSAKNFRSESFIMFGGYSGRIGTDTLARATEKALIAKHIAALSDAGLQDIIAGARKWAGLDAVAACEAELTA